MGVGVLAVTRSLGDASMKEFVVGSPYTTETELGDEDEFLIIACDGVRLLHLLPRALANLDNLNQLWDVIEDDAAVELVRSIPDPQAAAKFLVRHALDHFSNDNITVLVVRFHGLHTAGVPPTK